MICGAARERRRSVRLRPVRAKALCSIRTGDDRGPFAWKEERTSPATGTGVCEVRDLSRGGVLLEGAPAVQTGTRVSVRVVIPGSEPLRLSGRVVRVSDGPHRQTKVAVGFSSVSADDEDRIAEWVADEWCTACRVVCVIAATSLHVRMELARRLGELGARVARARTPIELIQRLEASREEATVVFLGETLGGCTDEEIATFLGAAYPRVRRVSVVARTGADGGTRRDWMHAAIEPPWAEHVLREQLQSAVGGEEPMMGG